jgi:hypothetical protein
MGFQAPQIASPMDLAQNAFALKGAMQQNSLAEAKMAEMQRQQQSQNALRQLFAGGKMPDAAAVYAISPEVGGAYEKSQQDIRKSKLDADAAYWNQQRDLAARPHTQESWSMWRGQLPQEFQRFVPEQYSPENQRRTLATGDKALEMFAPKIQFQDTAAGVEGIDVSPDSPTFGQTRIRRGAAPKPPGTVVNVGDKGNIAATEGVVNSLIRTREGLAQAPILWQNLEDAKALIPQAKSFMGAGGEFSLEAASFLNNRFGTNIDVSGVKNATELRSRMFQGIVATLKQLDSNPSQSQQAALQQALGGLGTDPSAMEKVINVAQDIISGRVERYNKDATKASQKLDFPIEMPIEMPTRTAPTATGAPPPPPGFKIR